MSNLIIGVIVVILVVTIGVGSWYVYYYKNNATKLSNGIGYGTGCSTGYGTGCNTGYRTGTGYGNETATGCGNETGTGTGYGNGNGKNNGNGKSVTFASHIECEPCSEADPGPSILRQPQSRPMPGPGAPHSIAISSMLENGMAPSTYAVKATNEYNAERGEKFIGYGRYATTGFNASVVDINGTPYSATSGQPILYKDVDRTHHANKYENKELANESGMSLSAANLVKNARDKLLQRQEQTINNPTDMSTSDSNVSLLQRARAIENPDSYAPSTDSLSLLNALVQPSYEDIARESNILIKENNLNGGTKIVGVMEGGAGAASDKSGKGVSYMTMQDDTTAINFLINLEEPDKKARIIDILNSQGKMGQDDDAVYYKARKDSNFFVGDLNVPVPEGQNPDDYLNPGIVNC